MADDDRRGNLIYLFDVTSGEEVYHLSEGGYAGWRLQFSPDGRTLAAARRDGDIRLLEIVSGKERGLLRGHRGEAIPVFSPDGRLLASGSKDVTVLLWDLAAFGRPGAPGRGLTTDILERLWADLTSADAGQAYRALWTLAAAPAQAARFLGARLHPVPVVGPKRLARLLADLDSDEFTIREKASNELENLGEVAESALLGAAKQPASAEVAHRVRRLLDKLRAARRTPSRAYLQSLRAVEALERMGGREAREVLDKLSRGAPGARLTQEARASWDRLAR